MRDYMLKQTIAQAARSAAPCDCGHTNGEHHELPREFIDMEASLAAGQIVSHPNPAYQPLVFHCDHDDCNCRIDRRND